MDNKPTMTELQNEDTISKYLDSINRSIESMRTAKDDIKGANIPSDFKIRMMGAKDQKVLNFIFDTKLDYAIDAMVNKFVNGDFSDIDRYAQYLQKAFEIMGVGQGAFEGPVSQIVMHNIINTLNTLDFTHAKNNIKKCFMIVKNLKRQAHDIPDKEVRKKYIDSVYALKKILKYISRIYNDRKLITDRVKVGVHNMVMENDETAEESLQGLED